jgi:phosphatidylglycerophosphate synthase
LEARMTDLATQAAWVLVAAFVLSSAYELFRATAKAGTSPHDSPASFVKNNVALYVVAALVILFLFADYAWAPWVGLVFSAVVTAASILYYNPKILLDRDPGIIDWFEDLVFTSLVFLAMALLLYHVFDVTLEP